MQRLFISFIFSLFVGNGIYAQISNEQVYKFNRVIDLISMFYVDTVQENKLIEQAIISVLKELDPHSTYISKEDVRAMNEPLQGSFTGIGILYQILRDTLYVTNIVPGGPSDKAGLKPGDRIVSIDDTNIAGVGLRSEEIRKLLTGNMGSLVSLNIIKSNNSGMTSAQIVRDQIPINSIDASYQVNETTGYIKLNRFSATSVEEFSIVAKKFKKAGLKNLILDLRDNGGGYLKAAIDIADEFLDDKKLIVYTNGSSSPNSEYFSTDNGQFEQMRLVVLVNEGTASASEILSGAIQDWDKGIIVGRRTYGKGLVQRPFNLADGSMIRLTIARYYTPTGRLIQRPYSNGHEKYLGDLKERYKNGELFSLDSIHFADSLKFKTLVNKRIVYGGGGIMPDIFVPADTTLYPLFYQKLMRNGKLSEYVLDYVDLNRKLLNQQYPKFENFKHKYRVGTDLLGFITKKVLSDGANTSAKSENLPENTSGDAHDQVNAPQSFNLDNVYINNHLKALIAQNLYNHAAYIEVLNNTDKTFLKAMSILSDNKQYLGALGK
jgi:carboxyl-terminal processing protease